MSKKQHFFINIIPVSVEPCDFMEHFCPVRLNTTMVLLHFQAGHCPDIAGHEGATMIQNDMLIASHLIAAKLRAHEAAFWFMMVYDGRCIFLELEYPIS